MYTTDQFDTEYFAPLYSQSTAPFTNSNFDIRSLEGFKYFYLHVYRVEGRVKSAAVTVGLS